MELQMNDTTLNTGDAQQRAKGIVYDALEEYAQGRIRRYQSLRLSDLLKKDLLMMAMRGVGSSEELLDLALAAFESSSEETQMGSFVQRIATDLAARAVDLGDLVVETPDGDLWIVEVKSQTNTVTGTFRNDLLRKMKERLDAQSRHRRVRSGQVRALLGVIRGDARSEEITCSFPAGDRYADLNGFRYTYKVGRPFWEWLTGRSGIASLVDAVPASAAQVAAARSAARTRLQAELEAAISGRGSERGVLAALRLADEQYH